MPVVGVGTDVVDVDRFAASLARTPALAGRLLTDRERVLPDGSPRPPASLAARFAAKEAVAKALGAPPGLAWHDAEVVPEPSGAPRLVLRGTVAARADALGVRGVHVTLAHDGGLATATVVVES